MTHLSIIIPCYNASPYIRNAINSLLCLKYSEYSIQIIIVDDASTDDSFDKITEQKQYASRYIDDRISLEIYRFSNNTPGGVSCAANFGMERACGQYLTFLDADDWIQPSEFLKAADFAFSSGDDFIINQCIDYKVPTGERSTHPDILKFKRLKGRTSLVNLKKQLMRVAAMPWRKFYLTDFLNNHNLRFDEVDYSYEDNPFHWRVVSEANNIGITEFETHAYRLGHAGQSVSGSGLKFLKMLDHFHIIENDLNQSGSKEIFREELVAWVIDHILWCGEHLSDNEQPLLYDKAHKILRTFPIDIISSELSTFPSRWVTNRILSIYYGDIRWFMELRG